MDSDVWELYFNILKVGVLVALALALVTGVLIGGCIAHA
jgi:hypothetical protein